MGRDAVRHMLGRRGLAGGLSNVLDLLQHSAPLLVRSQMDAKATLDQQLRTACEAYIRHATDTAAKPLTDALAIAAAAIGGGAAFESSVAAPIACTLDLSPIADAVTEAEAGIQCDLTRVHALMTRYIPETQTQEILFAPVRANVLDVLGEV